MGSVLCDPPHRLSTLLDPYRDWGNIKALCLPIVHLSFLQLGHHLLIACCTNKFRTAVARGYGSSHERPIIPPSSAPSPSVNSRSYGHLLAARPDGHVFKVLTTRNRLSPSHNPSIKIRKIRISTNSCHVSRRIVTDAFGYFVNPCIL
jgi:hypothetical protein